MSEPHPTPQHVCGVMGFDQIKGDICPACRQHSERQADWLRAHRDLKSGYVPLAEFTALEAERDTLRRELTEERERGARLSPDTKGRDKRDAARNVARWLSIR